MCHMPSFAEATFTLRNPDTLDLADDRVHPSKATTTYLLNFTKIV